MSLRLDWCNHEAAKYAVEHWHYSGTMPAGKAARVGVWEHGQFIGAVIFSRGANNNIGAPYGLSQIEVCELVRVALYQHEAPTSRILSVAIKLLQRQSSGLRLIVSYADMGQGHLGVLYQATNWIYAGYNPGGEYRLVNGKVVHGRSVRAKYGTAVGFKMVQGSIKHRYLMPLDAEMKRQIAPLAKPYPKRAESILADATAIHAVESGAAPTSALQQVTK